MKDFHAREHVHGNAKAVGQEQQSAHGAAELRPNRLFDHAERAAPLKQQQQCRGQSESGVKRERRETIDIKQYLTNWRGKKVVVEVRLSLRCLFLRITAKRNLEQKIKRQSTHKSNPYLGNTVGGDGRDGEGSEEGRRAAEKHNRNAAADARLM